MANGAERLTQVIRALIAEKRFKQAEVARSAGMSPQQLNDTLSGVDSKLSTIEKIAKALGVPAFYLLMSAQERAQWDEIGKPKQIDLSAIERRLAALEAAKPCEQSESLGTPADSEDSLIEGAKVLQELEHVVNDRPLKKRERKMGNG